MKVNMPISFLNQFMYQNWEDLVMLHYKADPQHISDRLPYGLEVDLCQDQAWLSVVAFRLTNLRIRPITWFRWRDFWEINLRTYVRDKNGKKGVWFYSLDSSDSLGVVGARLLYGLPYFHAEIHRDGMPQSGKLTYSGTRKDGSRSSIGTTWKPEEVGQKLAKGELDHFLLERYRFWSRPRFDKVCGTACVNHRPYDAVRISSGSYQGDLFSSQEFKEPEVQPVFGHYCPGFSVVATAPSWAFSISGQANQR